MKQRTKHSCIQNAQFSIHGVIVIEIGDRCVANRVKSELNERVSSSATESQVMFRRDGNKSLLNPGKEDNYYIDDVDGHCLASTIANERDMGTKTDDPQNLEHYDNSKVTIRKALKSLATAVSVMENDGTLSVNA